MNLNTDHKPHGITQQAVLVKVSYTSYGDTRSLERIRTAVANDNNADKEMFIVKTKFMRANPEFDALIKLIPMSRNRLRDLTLPWDDSGDRLLSMMSRAKFANRVKVANQKFLDAINDLYNKYDSRIPLVQKALGNAVNDVVIPTKEEVCNAFTFNVSYKPIADMADFRVQAEQEVIDEMRTAYNDSLNAQLQSATNNIWERVHPLLDKLRAQLTDNDNGTSKRLYASLVTDANEVADLMKACNFVNDAKISSAHGKLARAIDGVTIETLRNSATQRADILNQVKQIQRDLGVTVTPSVTSAPTAPKPSATSTPTATSAPKPKPATDDALPTLGF